MIQTLRRKFVLITMLLVSVVLLAVFFGLWLYTKTNLENESYMSLQGALDHKGGRGGGKDGWFEVGGGVPPDFQRDPVFVARVEQGAAVLLSADRVNVSDEELQDCVAQVLASGKDRGALSAYQLRYLVKQQPDGSVLIAFTPLSLEHSRLRGVVLITGISVGVAFVVFLVASMLLARWALGPVERSWAQQNRFVADASHELKTPLTVILANTGILKKDPLMGDEQKNWLESTENEAHRMKGLVDDMLFLAKRDDGSPPTEKTPGDFSALVKTSALAFESLAFERGLALEVEAEPGIQVVCDPAQMRQVVGILVDNAVKYGGRGSQIRVQLKKRAGSAVLTVFNESDAIPPEQLAQLFDRFYRTDASRSTKGSGLGLSIAKTLVEEHKGRISVQNTGGGTLFTVELPAR